MYTSWAGSLYQHCLPRRLPCSRWELRTGTQQEQVKGQPSALLHPALVVAGCPSSLSGEDRLVNVFGALVCQDRAIIVTDFSRLVRFHVFSRPVLWSPADVLPKSEVGFLMYYQLL